MTQASTGRSKIVRLPQQLDAELQHVVETDGPSFSALGNKLLFAWLIRLSAFKEQPTLSPAWPDKTERRSFYLSPFIARSVAHIADACELPQTDVIILGLREGLSMRKMIDLSHIRKRTQPELPNLGEGGENAS